MSKSQGEITRQIVTYARKLLSDRGWHYKYSCGPGSRMNIRSAVSAATTHLVLENSQWHREYIAAINAIASQLDEGVQIWELGTKRQPRTEAEVLQLLDTVINRLERHENRVRTSLGAGSSTGTV